MWKENLTNKIILASASPRRREIMKMADIEFETLVIPDLDESYPNDMISKDVPVYISKKKAEQYKSHINDNDILITCDTVVELDGIIIGKPKDRNDAVRMLSLLSGKTHNVITGVTITFGSLCNSFCDVTKVTFSEISDADIQYYIDNYRPYDKAGSYGIQEWIGIKAVRRIEGSFYNVMGLPIDKILEKLHFIFAN